jgi:hypothetical protein
VRAGGTCTISGWKYALVSCGLALAACRPPAGVAPTYSGPPQSIAPSATLKPADAAQPAAGACAPAEGPVAVLQINPDVPFPRCQRVQPEQWLRLVNRAHQPAVVRLAGFELMLEPGEEATIDQPFGTYLEPGVHLVPISVYAGNATLWLDV